MNEKVFAIIVTYNPDRQTLQKQYQSLESQVDGIIYVDNASSDLTLLKEFQQHEHIRVEFNSRNNGLGHAHNQGVQIARESGANFVLILDHDSILRQDFVRQLMDGYNNLSQKGICIGAVGPVYVNEKTGEKYPITKYWGPFIKRLYPSQEPQEASVLISSGTLIPIKVLDEVGCMNEDLFIDYIDIEWSYRTRRGGYSLYAIPKAVMNHVIGDNRVSVLGRSISVHSPLRRYYLTRNSIYMLKSPYVNWGYKLRELTFNILRITVYSIISSDRTLYLKYSFKGLKDGLKGKYGIFNS